MKKTLKNPAVLLLLFGTLTITGCKKEKQKQEEEKNQEAESQKPKLLNKIMYSASNIGLPSEVQLYTMNSDGTDEKQLTSLPNPDYMYLGDASWSPDGTKIVFISNESGQINYEIYIMNADGTGITRLTNGTRIKTNPCFSPDGKSIMFTSTLYPVEYNTQLFTMNIDGTGEKQLTSFENHGIFNYTLAGEWSPDGKKIVFMSNKDQSSKDIEGAQIFTMNNDGTGATKLTTKAKAKNYPSYSPDGTKILFQGNIDGKPNQSRIFTINTDGTGEKQITNNQITANSPTWSPDGKKIIFSGSTDLVAYKLYTINADGTGLTKLDTRKPYAFSPVWR